MKSLFRSIIPILLFVVVVATGCTKYPDGPKFSVRTKKSRACGSWVYEQVLAGSKDLTSDYKSLYPGYIMNISRDGTYEIRWNGFAETGRWEFDKPKYYLVLQNDPGFYQSTTTSMKILKLENDALWVTDGSNLEVHFANTQK